MDIVRPSLEDFQPIALRLRLALLGIYIVKEEMRDGQYIMVSISVKLQQFIVAIKNIYLLFLTGYV